MTVCIVNLGCMNGHPITTIAVESENAEPTDAEFDAWAEQIKKSTLEDIKSGEIWDTCPHCGISLRMHEITLVASRKLKTLEDANKWLEEGSKIGTQEAKAAMRKRVH